MPRFELSVTEQATYRSTPYRVANGTWEREERSRDLVGFKNKCYENASCGLVVQTSAVHVAALVIWGP